MKLLSKLSQSRWKLLENLRRWLGKDSHLSFSQAGEDQIIRFLLSDIQQGFYVDIGCNDPVRISNTYSLYQRGWSGLNIDLDETCINQHRALKPRDTSLIAAVSNEEKEMTVYEFEDTEVNTLAREVYHRWKFIWKFKQTRQITTTTLQQIFEENNITHTDIDLLSIDVEGLDFQVLQSFDIEQYRPKLIVIELMQLNLASLTDLRENEIYIYLKDNGYLLSAYSGLNAFFIDQQYLINKRSNTRRRIKAQHQKQQRSRQLQTV